MRHMEICRKNIKLNEEKENTVVYYVTIEELSDLPAGMTLETYGVGITISESGETEIIPNVTFSKTSILALVELLAAQHVTPVSVGDIVEDWLCTDSF